MIPLHRISAFVGALLSAVGCASAQNLITDVNLLLSTTVTTTTSWATDGKWQFEQPGGAGSTITFPSNTPFNTSFGAAAIYAAPLNAGDPRSS